jgi:serine/threonine protein kinase/Tol biopolymer transport system component
LSQPRADFSDAFNFSLMKDTLPVRVRFGAFELDLHTGELHGGEETVQLGEKPFRVLLILTEREGELATREEIQKKLWPNNTVVDFEHGINAAIKSLRRALGDSADNPKYIETLARHGYRLIVPVEWVNAGKDGEGQELRPAVLTGRTVSHYRVLDIIGGGGMGVVYRAEDLKLGRRVALKFLPEELGSDPQALERFSREARAASSLDHSNICPIHEFGEHEGRPFIVMQLLEGQTLRDRLAADEPLKPLPLEELLDTGIQVCDGLQAAHEKGIIHRDIKPANIFLTGKGVVKILDFGLAKLVEAVDKEQSPEGVIPSAERSEASRDPYNRDNADGMGVPRLAAQVQGRSLGMTHKNDALGGAAEAAPLRTPADATLTRTGLAMGTASYMSPEQVRGEKLDARTDIFSFGLVLYEMATGQRAFTGETAAVVHASILNNSPIPVRELNSALAAKLVTAIDKALEKDREQRHQSIGELRGELDRVKSYASSRRTTAGRRRRALRLTGALVALMAAVAVAWFGWRRLGPSSRPTERQITFNAPGNRVTAGAISPDGKYVAYHDQTGLYLRNVESGESRLVGLPGALPSGLYGALLWFAGGRKLLADVDGKGVSVITVSGEEQPRLLYQSAVDPAISPDGRMIAFINRTLEAGHERRHELWVGNVNGGTPRKLVAAEETEYLSGPAWSPDGQWITYGRAWKPEQGSWHSAIEVCPAAGGPAKTFLAESSLPKPNTFVFVSEEAVFSETWSPDWRLVFSVTRGSRSKIENSLWQVRVKPGTTEVDGNPEPVTQWDESGFFNLASTTDNKRLSFAKNRFWVDVYAGELDPGNASMKAPRSLARTQPGMGGPSSWTRDGRFFLVDSMRNGRREVVRQPIDRTAAENLVAGSRDVCCADTSPDGAWLLYLESEAQVGENPDSIWLMRRSTSGGQAEKVLELPAAEFDSFRCRYNPKASSPCVLGMLEGENLVFYSLDPVKGKGRQLGKIAVLGFSYMRAWDLSPDGSGIAVVSARKREGKIEFGARIYVLTLSDGTWHRISAEPWDHASSVAGREETRFCQIAWAADGKGFFVTAKIGDSFNLLHVTSDGKVQPLLANEAFQNQFLSNLLPSPDGKYLSFLGPTWDGNVWTIDNF